MTDQRPRHPSPTPRSSPASPTPVAPTPSTAGDGVDGEFAEPDPPSRDLDPDKNPAVEDALPDEMTETEDTDTEATKSDGGDVDVDQEDESPA